MTARVTELSSNKEQNTAANVSVDSPPGSLPCQNNVCMDTLVMNIDMLNVANNS